VAYSVARRTKEIGIRIALGAGRTNITGVVLRHLLIAVSAGLILGTAVAVAAGRLFAFLLLGVTPTDAQAICGAALIMCLATSAPGHPEPVFRILFCAAWHPATERQAPLRRIARMTFSLTHTDCSSKTISLYEIARLLEA
jgi:ABC-type antimicrobial peptide transport system permease subunit